MLAKVYADCTGNKAVSNLTIDAKLQKKKSGKWVSVTKNKTPYSKVKLGKKYTAYTHDLKCQEGSFRAYFRISGKVAGKMRYGNWAAGSVRKNPCG